jgi:cell division protein FtsL
MNAISHTLSNNVFAKHGVTASESISLKMRLIAYALTALILLSAFAVVYMKDLNRRLFIQYQGLQHVTSQLQVQWGKLLLEQSAWSTQARIQNVAMKKLNMVVPTRKDIVLVEMPADK